MENPSTREKVNPQASGSPSPVVTTPPVSLITDVGRATISHGHFALLTDGLPPQGNYAVIRNMESLDISGGQFFVGSRQDVTLLFNDTADAARDAFKRGDGKQKELDDR